MPMTDVDCFENSYVVYARKPHDWEVEERPQRQPETDS